MNICICRTVKLPSVVYGQLALQGTQQGRADLPRKWEPTRRACLLVVTNGWGSLVLQVYYNKQLKTGYKHKYISITVLVRVQ